jgi:hypothetical protein
MRQFMRQYLNETKTIIFAVVFFIVIQPILTIYKEKLYKKLFGKFYDVPK